MGLFFESRPCGDFCYILLKAQVTFEGEPMANAEQLEILNQGAEIWNQWRKENPDTKIDLFKANFRDANFRNIDFRDAYLLDADLSNADLREAVLINAYLVRAHLCGADLSNSPYAINRAGLNSCKAA